jgi:hypothetical protein
MSWATKQGIVYVLTNEGMPGVVKIGYTQHSLRSRLLDTNRLLGRCGDLPAFVAEFYAKSGEADAAERRMHQKFAARRVVTGTRIELFEVELAEVRVCLEELVGPAIDVPSEAWPWPVARPRITYRKQKRVPGGRPVYRWLYENHDRVRTRIGEADFSWPTLSYEIGMDLARLGWPFRPPAPFVTKSLWESVCRMVHHHGMEPLYRWPSLEQMADAIRRQRPSGGEDPSGRGDGAREALTSTRMDVEEF